MRCTQILPVAEEVNRTVFPLTVEPLKEANNAKCNITAACVTRRGRVSPYFILEIQRAMQQNAYFLAFCSPIAVADWSLTAIAKLLAASNCNLLQCASRATVNRLEAHSYHRDCAFLGLSEVG